MADFNISSAKTQFGLEVSSAPPNGTVTYTCPYFFNVTGGTLTYTGNVISGLEIFAEINNNTSDRTGSFGLTATTSASSDYEGTASITCAWTITQEGTGSSREVTSIELDNVEWVTDVPWTGGTASLANCSYVVVAIYSDETTEDVTNAAIVVSDPASITVSETTHTTRETVGRLYLSASYTIGGNTFYTPERTPVLAYQAAKDAFSVPSIVNNFPGSGGT